MDVVSAALTEPGGGCGGGGHGLRGRAVISRHQRQLLEAVYARNPRPTAVELDRLAVQLSAVPRRVVRVWFQNKRARDRRRGAARGRSLSQSSSSSGKTPPVYLQLFFFI